MKLTTLLALASASVITANAGEVPTTYYKVKINADATLQTAPNETTNAKVATSDVIGALIDQFNRDNVVDLPSTKSSDYDIVACYAGGSDQVMEVATYFLVRARGQGNLSKTQIPANYLFTDGGTAVFNRVFTAKSSTLKVNVTDSFSRFVLNTFTLDINASGLSKAQVTVKNFDDGTAGNEFLSGVKNSFSGHHTVLSGTTNGVGSINAKVEGVFKTEAFEELTGVGWNIP